MFIVVVDHFCKADRTQDAIGRIDHNGDQMASMPGFQFRYRMVGTANPLKISTVTGWIDASAYDGWIKRKRGIDATASADPKESPYESATNATYVVEREHGAAVHRGSKG